MANLDFFHNPSAASYQHYVAPGNINPKTLHSQLPDFQETPLVNVPKSLFGLDNVYIKDESTRLGLPSFKILGASWATLLAVLKKYGCGLDFGGDARTVFRDLQNKLAKVPNELELVTATDGNHGRAIAYMARLIGQRATIFVPHTVNEYTRQLIQSEGAQLMCSLCDYDETVTKAHEYALRDSKRLFIQDTSFEGYHEIPNWIIQGYTTMFEEIEEQLTEVGLKATHIFTPVGVGSLAHAVVAHSKSKGRSASVVAVESEVAACLQTSLRNGHQTSISTQGTIMDGINCGSVSDISWPILKEGVDGLVTISDRESHASLQTLGSIGIYSGPCGASTTAALQKLLANPTACAALEISHTSVIVLLNTEGPREYEVPR